LGKIFPAMYHNIPCIKCFRVSEPFRAEEYHYCSTCASDMANRRFPLFSLGRCPSVTLSDFPPNSSTM
jgi:hypothetical protein